MTKGETTNGNRCVVNGGWRLRDGACSADAAARWRGEAAQRVSSSA